MIPVAERIAALGLGVEPMGAVLDVDDRTVRRWIQQGEQAPARTLVGRFAGAVRKGRTLGEMRALSAITQAALAGKWEAAAWRLERCNPRYRLWGRCPICDRRAAVEDPLSARWRLTGSSS